MCPADTSADAPVDDLQRMLADKAARRVADEQTRMRIAAEVDVAMDNGGHINLLLRQVYGERRPAAARHRGRSARSETNVFDGFGGWPSGCCAQQKTGLFGPTRDR